MPATTRASCWKLLCGLLPLLAYAQLCSPQSTGGNYEVRAHAVDSGGAATGGGFALHGAIGQPAAGTANGGSYAVSVGLLRERASLPDALFSDGFE